MMRPKVTDKSYQLVESYIQYDDKPVPTYSVKLLEKPYDGIIVSYGKVLFRAPQNPDEPAALAFKFKLENATDTQLENSPEFKTHLGDILVHIVESTIQSGKFKLTNGSKPTDNGSSETGQ